jgi:ankyrin repeat protein
MNRHWHEDDLRCISTDFVRAYCDAVAGYISELDDFGYTPLVAACSIGNTAVARVLLQAGADANFIAADGESPLKAAIPRSGAAFNRELFDSLLAAGADPNAGNEPALYFAVVRGLREHVQYLLEHGADPNLADVDGMPPLFWAIADGGRSDLSIVRLLVGRGANVTRRDCDGRTAEERIGATLWQKMLLLGGVE